MARVMQYGSSPLEPAETRENMDSSEMEPDDGRQLIVDIITGIRNRTRKIPKDRFDNPDPKNSPMSYSERARQFYPAEQYQTLQGIKAALDQWDRSGKDIEEMKEKYGGHFVKGVEIGERLAVYEGTDFEFCEESGTDESSEGKFTFIE